MNDFDVLMLAHDYIRLSRMSQAIGHLQATQTKKESLLHTARAHYSRSDCKSSSTVLT